jgi:imidazolonepropionase-like amidohydrolase
MHIRLLAIALFAWLLSLSTLLLASDLVLVGAKVYPSPTDPPIENATIVIHHGRIVAVGPSAKVKAPYFARAVTIVNCKGMVVSAGFWNSHVHFTEDAWKNAGTSAAPKLEEHMQRMLTEWGFTSVFDTASFIANTNALRARVNKNEVPGPRIFTVSEPLYPKNGIPPSMSGGTLSSKEAMRLATLSAALNARLQKDADLPDDTIRIIIGDP